MSMETFKAHFSEVVKHDVINRWISDLIITQSRKLKTDASHECDFNTDSYLNFMSIPKHRTASSNSAPAHITRKLKGHALSDQRKK